MSLFDSTYVDAKFTPTSQSHPAPTCMDHPAAGRFHLTNIILFEKHEGPVRVREHRHRVYHLLIFDEGQNEFTLNGKRTRSSRGTCVLSEPGDMHCFLPRNAGSTLYHAVTFTFDPMRTPPSWPALLAHYTGCPLDTVPSVFEIPEHALLNLPPLLAGLRTALSLRNAFAARRIHFGVLQLFAFVAEALVERQRHRLSSAPAPELAAHDYLDAHYADRISLNDVARQTGVSLAHLSRAFKRRYGISPSSYRASLRMDAAGNLLRRSDLLVKEVAYQLGYPDLFTFSKAVRRHHHCSPTAFSSR